MMNDDDADGLTNVQRSSDSNNRCTNSEINSAIIALTYFMCLGWPVKSEPANAIYMFSYRVRLYLSLGSTPKTLFWSTQTCVFPEVQKQKAVLVHTRMFFQYIGP